MRVRLSKTDVDSAGTWLRLRLAIRDCAHAAAMSATVGPSTSQRGRSVAHRPAHCCVSLIDPYSPLYIVHSCPPSRVGDGDRVRAQNFRPRVHALSPFHPPCRLHQRRARTAPMRAPSTTRRDRPGSQLARARRTLGCRHPIRCARSGRPNDRAHPAPPTRCRRIARRRRSHAYWTTPISPRPSGCTRHSGSSTLRWSARGTRRIVVE